MPRWLKLVVVGVLVVVAAIALAGLALLALLDRAIGPELTQDSPEVRSWLERTEPELAARADRFADAAVAGLPAGTRPVGGVSTWRCERGQHNWKIDDPYDLACTQQVGVLLAVPATEGATAATPYDPDAFLGSMRSLEQRFGTAGAAGTDEDGLVDHLSGYADGFNEQRGERVYGPPQLPGYGWGVADGDASADRRSLVIVFTGPEEPNPEVLLYPGDSLEWTDGDGDRTATSTVPRLLEGASYGLLVTVSADETWDE